jgi:hypothetical protein
VRVATFGLDETLEHSLAAGSSQPVRCSPDSPEAGTLPAALEAAESALAAAGAEAALIAGDDDWALAAALACAKAVVRYAFVSAGDAGENGNSGHIRRLADFVIPASDGPEAAESWLATLGD